ncbi:MAG: sulfurtransferase TusA family protein [Atopobiaceae bacterium]|nr:sulfurtransferase TusA family protein [Atopobiaceae bacterium]
MDTLDARGLSCPEPVVMISQAMASKADSYRMIVDAVAARENVTRYAQSQGYTVNVTENGSEWTLNIAK